MLLEQFVGQCDELSGANFEPGFFEPADHFAGVVAVETVGFQQNQGAFNSHGVQSS